MNEEGHLSYFHGPAIDKSKMKAIPLTNWKLASGFEENPKVRKEKDDTMTTMTRKIDSRMNSSTVAVRGCWIMKRFRSKDWYHERSSHSDF